jgi:hypothetical protein
MAEVIALGDDEDAHDRHASMMPQPVRLGTGAQVLVGRAGSLLVAGLLSLLSAAPAAAIGLTPHVPITQPHQERLALNAPHRVSLPKGQHIIDHPSVLLAVNAARQHHGWAPAVAGSNYAAEACALNYRQCDGVQWGGCGLIPLPGGQYTATIGSAESNGPRGCIQAISYSSFS